MILVAGEIARETAMMDPGFIVPPEYEARQLALHNELKKVTWYTGYLGTPEKRRADFIANTYLSTDNNGGIRFMVGDKPLDYTVSWDAVTAGPFLSDGLLDATDPDNWYKWKWSKRYSALAKSMKASEKIKKNTEKAAEDATDKLNADIKQRDKDLSE